MPHSKHLLCFTLGVCLVASAGCKKSQNPAGQSDGSSSPAVAIAAIPSGPSLGPEQNDSEGYSGRSWGSTNTDGLVRGEEMWNFNMLTKVIGPPGEVINDFYLPSERTSPEFKVYAAADNDRVTYGYFDDKLAFALVRLNGSFADAASDLTNKYGRGLDVGPESLGDSTAPAKWEGYGFSGAVYRRGKTNTRIWLMRSIDESGDTREVDLLYMPNSSLQAIRSAWWGKYNALKKQAEQQQQAAEDAARHHDRQSIQ